MTTVGIIAEFNPFHNGHKYLIEQARKRTGADNVIVICSGNFVQRGTPAIFDKSIRAEMAIKNGVDAFFELPDVYSTASAELFARASVKFLASLNCVDYLCFGCETDQLEELTAIASILHHEPKEYRFFLNQSLKNGLSFPKARTMALAQYCRRTNLLNEYKIDLLLSQPNNILAMEYIKAIKYFRSSIKPVAIKRIGAGYHSTNTASIFASATGIRKHLNQNEFDKISGYLPENCISIIPQNQKITFNDFDTILGTKLLCKSDFTDIYGINEDLSNRINNYKSEFIDTETFIKKLQSKNYTYSAISRALLHIILDIKTEDVEKFIVEGYFTYARLLGFNRKSPILSMIKENSDLDIISKFADYYHHVEGISKNMLDISIKADNLYRMVYMNKYKKHIPTEFERQIVIA